ncbi:MAG: flagellar basal-body rod protein FlgF [Pseudomonadota bacterium]
MDNTLLVGLSAQQVLRQRLDVSANNLANMDTVGFKAEALVNREIEEKPARVTERPSDVVFVDAWALQRDMSVGPIERTGNPLDVAIEGDGFFAIESPGGEPVYTRDGRFSIDGDGRLVTRSGLLVLGEGDAPIQTDPEAGPVKISQDGAIGQGDAEIGRFKLVDFQTSGALEKIGDGLLKATVEEPGPPETIRLAQGFVEGSNVQAIGEMTRLIEISRAYEGVSRMLNQSNQLREKAVDKLARVG